MKETEQIMERLGETVEYAKLYVEQRKDMLKLDVTEKVSTSAGSVATKLIVGGIALIALLFLSVTAALALGYWWDNFAYGFLAVSVLYIIMAIIVYTARRSIITDPIVASVIKKMYEAPHTSADEQK